MRAEGQSEMIAERGATLVELAVAIGILALVLGTVVMATMGAEGAFLESQVISQLNLRAQLAMERIVELSSQASTADAEFAPLAPSTGVGSHGLTFRLVQLFDTYTNQPLYDDSARVYIHGPDAGTEACAGLVVGRGPDFASVHAAAKGADGLLGTADDVATASLVSGIPAVEILVPDTFAPRTGSMLTVDVNPAPIGRLLTFTIRLNARTPDGQFVLPNDLVLTERVALRR